MKFKVHHNEEIITIEAETVEDIRRIAKKELFARLWNEDDCWSEEVSDAKQAD